MLARKKFALWGTEREIKQQRGKHKEVMMQTFCMESEVNVQNMAERIDVELLAFLEEKRTTSVWGRS